MTLADQVAKYEERGLGYIPVAKSTDWETPPALFDALDQEFGPFTLDACGTPEQYTARRIVERGGWANVPPDCVAAGHYLPDGLGRDWQGTVWMNPPYGRSMPAWIERAVREVVNGRVARVVALIPARTDTRAWQTHVLREAAFDRMVAPDYVQLVRFLGANSPGMEGRSRVRFGGASAGAPFPCAVVVWELT